MPSPSSTYKKVVVHKLNQELIKGFVDPKAYLGLDRVEVLDREGRLVNVPLEEVKGIFFVREFEGDPQRSERKVFHSRPRLSGLWIRMTFRDNEILEGLISTNLLDFDPLGFLVTPPDLYSNTLRMFVPRNALAGIEVLGVVSDGAARRANQRGSEARRRAADTSRQIGLFSPSSQPVPK